MKHSYFSSTPHKDQAREAINGWNVRRQSLPRCGAKRRNGDLCRNWPLGNGRCRFHGGTVPKGDKWHRAKFPAKNSKAVERKTRMKLEKLQQREKTRLARLALMTPHERERHERRRKALKGGSAVQRLSAKVDAQNNASARAIMNGSGGRPARADPEYEAIAARIAELRALQAQATTDKDPGSNPAAEIETYRHPNIGVFE